jgi:hypothetical protein
MAEGGMQSISTRAGPVLTSDHAVFVNDVLVSVKPLVNVTNIARDPRHDGSRDMSSRPCIAAQ